MSEKVAASELTTGREVARAQDLRRVRRPLLRPRRKSLRDRAADDHFDDLRVGEFARRRGRDMPAVAQDRHVIAKRPHLAHAMRDEDNGDALAA